jgi:hypothetical protein
MPDEETDMQDDESSGPGDPGGGTGRGGPLGTPTSIPDEAPPSTQEEGNQVVSGGGLAGPDDDQEPIEHEQSGPSAD